MEMTREEVWQAMCAVYAKADKDKNGRCFDPLYMKFRAEWARVYAKS